MSIKEKIMHFPKIYKILFELNFYKRYFRNKRLFKKSPRCLVERMYQDAFGEGPNLDNPSTFNEKLQWMKLFWYDERAQICSDKYLVREYVKEKNLGHILNELISVYDSPDDIKIDDLPDQFVLKTTHDSGHVIICDNKSRFNIRKAKRKLNRWLKVDYEYMSGEWPYNTSHKRIVCEKFIEDIDAGELLDYKFFCFNGAPTLIFFNSDRANHAKSDFYDLNWNLLPFRWTYETSGKVFPRPNNLDEMIKYAKILSEGFPFVRVDFYNVDNKVIFGELTFFHGGGLGWFEPKEKDREFGEKIVLPEICNPWEKIQL